MNIKIFICYTRSLR